MRTFNPLTADHPALQERCMFCGSQFVAGDLTTLIELGPLPGQEELAAAGRVHNAEAKVVHATCAARVTGGHLFGTLMHRMALEAARVGVQGTPVALGHALDLAMHMVSCSACDEGVRRRAPEELCEHGRELERAFRESGHSITDREPPPSDGGPSSE